MKFNYSIQIAKSEDGLKWTVCHDDCVLHEDIYYCDKTNSGSINGALRQARHALIEHLGGKANSD